MKQPMIMVLTLALVVSGISFAEAHAFLDHAEPRVGGSVNSSMGVIKIWFTSDLKEGQIQVFNVKGEEVDKKDVRIDASTKSLMSVSVPKLSAGSYKVVWNAVCPFGHHTSGNFSFEVTSP